ncbi:MAG: iron-containing alcohol dehydrogenase [Thermodesulfobacteriota bacterium]
MGVFHFTVKILFGEGCLRTLPEEAALQGATRPLVVTDPGIASAGLLDHTLAPLKKKGLDPAVYDGVEPDPKLRNVREAAEIIKKGGHDLVIAVGGGSAMDAAKAAAIQAANDIDIREFQGPRPSYPRPPLPLFTVPTTAGTGSEVSSAAVVVDEEKKYKMYFKSPQIFSRIAFLDPVMIAGMPSWLAAAAGADTLSHAVESYLNPNRTAFTEANSLGALELVFKNLRPFVGNTRNSEAARSMMLASAMAGISMTTAGLGLVHALAHPIGVWGGVHHGTACGMLLPHVMAFNWLAEPARFERLAQAMDWRLSADYPPREIGMALVQAVRELLEDIGLPASLSKAGKKLPDLGPVVDEALGSALNKINPRPANRSELENLIHLIL